MTTPVLTVDQDLATTCRQLIVDLQNAYMQLVAGNVRVKVRFNERWTEYSPGHQLALMQLIESIWAQCPDTSGLLDLRPGARTQRGRPAPLRIR